jgi:hypothetical protein
MLCEKNVSRDLNSSQCSPALLLLVLLPSSHREAPLISNDPLADNTDVYAFRSPERPDKIIIVANYIPGQLPQGGPNYYSFGENIRYEIHIDNDATTPGDDITYRFLKNEPHAQHQAGGKFEDNVNEKWMGKTASSEPVNKGVVPPPNIGPRSISSPVGLNQHDYNEVIDGAITTASTTERVYCGSAEDPFYVDLGGIFDLGDAPRTTGSRSQDGLKCLNVSSIVMEVGISVLQKNRREIKEAKNILDPNYIIGVGLL